MISAAVADFMVPLAFGSQTAGSIVRPAAYCGVVGYKPTFGTVNRVGVKMISDTLDTIGGFARSVPDVALFVAALCGRRELLIDGPSVDAPRIGLCKTYEWNCAEPETIALFDDLEKQLRGCGARVRDVTLPSPFAGLARAQTAKERGIKYFLISYTDLFGTQRAKLVPAIAIGEEDATAQGDAIEAFLARPVADLV